MRKFTFYKLALTIGLVSANVTLGQAPYGYQNVGPSSFPVTQQVQQQHTSSVLQNLPQVPQNYSSQPNYQFIGMQEQIHGYAEPPMATQPLPMAAPDMSMHQAPIMNSAPMQSNGCQSCAQPMPAMDYGYQQSIAPNCTSCGPAPVSQQFFDNSYVQSGYGYGQPAGRHGLLHGLAGLPAGAKPWFFGGGVLFLHRVDDNTRLLTTDDTGADVMFTDAAQLGTATGFEVMSGRYFNCGRNAIVGSYWGAFPDTVTYTATAGTPGDYRARILGVGDAFLTVDPTGAGVAPPGYDAYTWFDDAAAHRVQRSAEYHNVEVNVLGFGVGCAARNFNRATAGTLFSGTRHGANCGYCGGAGCGACGGAAASKFATGPCGYVAPACGSRLNLSWLAGLRYFRFEDNLQFAADFNGDGINRAADDLYYDVNTTNDLVGAQIGGRADLCVGRRINAFGLAKVGVFNNRSTVYHRLGTDTILATDPVANQYITNVTDNDIAFVSELGSGLGFCVSPKWTATVGYRAVIASGVATSVGNLRHRADWVPTSQTVVNDNILVLHGLNIGAIYNF